VEAQLALQELCHLAVKPSHLRYLLVAQLIMPERKLTFTEGNQSAVINFG